jgi:hypothetical protein
MATNPNNKQFVTVVYSDHNGDGIADALTALVGTKNVDAADFSHAGAGAFVASVVSGGSVASAIDGGAFSYVPLEPLGANVHIV